jgi:hypothetical protein
MTNQNQMQNSGQINQIKQLASALKNSNNPMQLLQNAGQNNPQIANVMNMLNGSGMSAKQMFNMVVSQRGIDGNQIINMLK